MVWAGDGCAAAVSSDKGGWYYGWDNFAASFASTRQSAEINARETCHEDLGTNRGCTVVTSICTAE